MKIAFLTGDNREPFRQYSKTAPFFGTAPEALLQGFADLPGVEVHVISGTRRPMTSPEKLAPNIWFHSFYVPRLGWTPTMFFGCARAVQKLLKKIQPDIVHGQGTERDCAISAVFSKFPNVLTIHGNMAELARMFRAPLASYGWRAGKLETIALRRTAGVFCNSEYTENLVKPRAKKTWRVPNALRQGFFDAPRKTFPPAGKFVLVNVGVISERKRQVELLDVARRLHERGLDFEIQFVGALGTSDAAYCARFQEKLGAAAGYARHFPNKSTAELIECFDAADALVHFPSEEAFGLAAAEALARDLKLFGAALGGLQDIASGVAAAELFDAGDWDGLTASIAGWMQQPKSRVNGASEVIRARYHPRVVAVRHVEIYREVLNNSTQIG
jgi:glycosyltransferase involved in cell wall biosynthesis